MCDQGNNCVALLFSCLRPFCRKGRSTRYNTLRWVPVLGAPQGSICRSAQAACANLCRKRLEMLPVFLGPLALVPPESVRDWFPGGLDFGWPCIQLVPSVLRGLRLLYPCNDSRAWIIPVTACADCGSPGGAAPVSVCGPEDGRQQHHQPPGMLLAQTTVCCPPAPVPGGCKSIGGKECKRTQRME